MTNGGVSRSLTPGIALKIGFPLLIGLITLLSAEACGMSGLNSLILATVVTFGAVLILFMVDTEMRISAMDERTAQGFAKIGKSAELSSMMERSSLGAALLTDFLQTASQADGQVHPLLQRLARREVER